MRSVRVPGRAAAGREGCEAESPELPEPLPSGGSGGKSWRALTPPQKITQNLTVSTDLFLVWGFHFYCTVEHTRENTKSRMSMTGQGEHARDHGYEPL